MTTLYKALLRPHLEYWSIIWGSQFKEVMRLGVPYLSQESKTYEDCLKMLNLQSLKYRQHKNDMVQTYKTLNGLIQIPEVPCKKATRAKFFSQWSINKWNKLTNEIVNVPSLNVFKKIGPLLERFVFFIWITYFDKESRSTGIAFLFCKRLHKKNG